ncbi:MAG: hypothetical protein JW741_10215 [Sedimentisphaerales bacterium]|nr:hypothetical protein [Sedimentisphaerales bacterium]
MKIKQLACYVLVAACGGCLCSLHPLYTEDTLVFRDELLGKWSDEEGIWEFRDAGDMEYELRVFDGKEGRFSAHLVQLEDMLFLDIYPADDTLEEMQSFSAMHLVPAHTFMKVEQIVPTLVLRAIDAGTVGDLLEEDPNLLKHEEVDDRLVLTASTEALQAFMLALGHDEDLFGDATELTRHVPLYGAANVTFADSLLGRWKGEEDETVKITLWDEFVYRITRVEEDGTECRCLANLVQAGETRLLALFFDEFAFDDDPNNFVPDTFMVIGQVEPELLLRPIGHDTAAELLGVDLEPHEEETSDTDDEPEPFEVFRRM